MRSAGGDENPTRGFDNEINKRSEFSDCEQGKAALIPHAPPFKSTRKGVF